VESGGADHFGLTDAEIAVTCGSHGGEDIHVQTVLSILDKIGVGPDALACGAHAPLDKEAARRLQDQGHSPSALHNNCSGKHSGMLALAKFQGWPIGGYETSRHPVQELITQTIAEFAGLQPDEVAIGVDGCGVCSFGIPVHSMAVSFARLAQADYWPEPRRSAILRIQRAMTTHPEMVGYRRGNLDTDMMRAGAGALLSKGGAEGVYCAARIGTGGELALGFALKILDGDPSGRARKPAGVEGLRQAGFLDEDALNKLEAYWMEEIRNRTGDVVGMVRPAFTLSTG
jgi:L-asparaginase II